MRISILCLAFFLLLPAVLLAAPAEVPQTGQTTRYTSGDDGDLQLGVASPDPRFTVNKDVANQPDGTITDNLTGLTWLANANCFGKQTWDTALSSSMALASGDCGLSDGSVAGDWRLPNIIELESLVDLERFNPALPLNYDSFFTGVQFSSHTSKYWSSTGYELIYNSSWALRMDNGGVGGISKNYDASYYVWPVRGGQ